MQNPNYILSVKTTGNKAGKYHYQVIDATGKVITERRSNREYVACTINGSYFFGRLDLIGKGDHGNDIKYKNGWGRNERGVMVPGKNEPGPQTPIAYTASCMTDGEINSYQDNFHPFFSIVQEEYQKRQEKNNPTT